MRWDWLNFLFYGFSFLIFTDALRVLNPIVTSVRARFGLAAAWAAAVPGFIVILGGFGPLA